MMNQDQFWNIIEASRHSLHPLHADGNMERQLKDLQRLLLALPPQEIIEFRNRFHEQMAAAFHWDLWGAASIIAGGCSNDGFAYFRSWLISRGQRIFTTALANPESLVDVADAPDVEDVFFEELLYVPAEVYRGATGRDIPPYTGRSPHLPEGLQWNSAENDLQLKFPRLWAKYRAP
jgi:hypothetical protein